MRASSWVLKRRRSSSSHSRVAKKLSHMALSKQSPTEPIRRPHPGLVTAFAEGERGVLAAMVGVMNHRRRPALSERHVKRCQYQFGAQMSFHRPAHNLAAKRVEHHRQVKKAGPGWNVADVSDPQTIGRRRGEVAFNQIWRGLGGAGPPPGGHPPAPA